LSMILVSEVIGLSLSTAVFFWIDAWPNLLNFSLL
jgi:hypothetical protein